MLELEQRSSGRVLIQAANLQEAHKLAKEILMDEVNNWEIYDDYMMVKSVDSVSEGQSHE